MSKANNKIRENVEHILEQYPNARNSDKLLFVMYWKLFDGLPIDKQTSSRSFANAFVKDSTSIESISRARRLIQQEGLFPPTDESVIKARSKKQILMKEAILDEREVV